MMGSGLHQPHQRPVKKIHPLRERRPCFGELIQIDGSHHAWFGGRAASCCLLVFIDDATGRLLHLQFTPSESHESYTQSLYQTLQKYAKPLAIYTDKYAVFSVNRKQLSVEADGVTAFNKSLHELKIESILAHSIEAQGRVNRANKTLQNRLIKEMRLRDLASMEAGNAFLEEFIVDFNARFSIQPAHSGNKHRPLSADEQERLLLILSKKEHRTVSKNLTVQVDKKYYQLDLNNQGHRIQQQGVLVCTMLQGEIIITDCEERILSYTPTSKPLKAPVACGSKDLNEQFSTIKHKPSHNHPWRSFHAALHQQHYRSYAQKLFPRRAI